MPTPEIEYTVESSPELSAAERAALADWYLPIIGRSAYALYIALIDSRLGGAPESERSFFLRLGWDARESAAFLDARRRLEGVGLLRTFFDRRMRRYALQALPPLVPERFVESEVLVALLLGRIGQTAYERLLRRYRLLDDEAVLTGEEVTAAFSEAFREVAPTELIVTPASPAYPLARRAVETANARLRRFGRSPGGEAVHPVKISLQAGAEPLDPLRLRARFTDVARPPVFDEAFIRTLQEWQSRYGLDIEQLLYLVRDAYDPSTGTIDADRFRTLAAIWQKVRGRSLSGERQPIGGGRPASFDPDDSQAQAAAPPEQDPAPGGTRGRERADAEDGRKRFEQHLIYLKSVSPYELLRNYQGGGELSPADERLVKTVLEDIGLPSEVVNVLIDYVLLVQDHKFPRAFTEKIAASWKRKGFRTAEEALAYARREYLRHAARRQKGTGARNAETADAASAEAPRRAKPHRRLPSYILAQLEAERALETGSRAEVTDDV
ncbi:MAG: DnaD domain protein [Hydrogenibacillus sp.]|nr:DnaD domain protein [Hydrogenibacillus sp.]